jgi:hypothetical protein
MASNPIIDSIAAIPGIIAAVVLTLVSIRAVPLKYPAAIAFLVGAAGGGAISLLIEHAVLGWK